MRTAGLAAGVVITCGASFGAGMAVQESREGVTFRSGAGGTAIEVLFDGEGREVGADVAIITFPPGTNSGDHQHDQTEIFFVLEGELEHVVNGQSTVLRPGDLGHVKPPDFVNHISDDGTRALVIWAPSGAIDRYDGRWERVGGEEGGR